VNAALANEGRVAHRLILLFLFVAGGVVRLICLACKPFWFDECFSAEIARIGWGNFLHLLWWREANMSLYYLLLRVWLSFDLRAGHSEFFIRSLSVLISASTLPAIYWLARALYDRRVAFIAAALFAFNAYSVRYAQEARSYSLFVLLATLSSGFLIRWLREPVRSRRTGYVLASILAVYAHFYAILLVAAHWVALRWLGRPDQAVNKTDEFSAQSRRAFRTIGLAVLPLLIFVAKTGAGPIKWIHRPSLHDIFEFAEHLAGSDHWPLAVIYAMACFAALAPFGKRLLARDQDWETWRCEFLLVWLLFPVVLTILLSFARPVFLARYMIFCLPALIILAAAGLARLRQTWLLAAALSGMLLFSGGGVWFVYGHDFDKERDESKAASNFVLEHTQAGDGIIFHIAETRVPYEFFRSERAGVNTASADFTSSLGPEILFPHNSPGFGYRDFTGKPTPELLRSAALSHARLWVMLMNNGPPGTPDPTTVMLTRVLAESFPRVQRWQFARVEVRLYRKE